MFSSTPRKMDNKPAMNGSRSRSRITLEDVLDSSPTEDKAETRILQSLEQDDEEKGNVSSARILSNTETTNEFQSNMQGELRREQADASTTSEDKGIEEDLYDLTNEMKGNSHDEEQSTTPQKSQAAGPFVANASRLMRRAHLTGRKNNKASFQQFQSFLGFRRDSIFLYARFALLYMIMPFLGLTCLLYYAFGNPGGKGDDQATASWWINFVLVRQVLTLSLAKATEAVIIDFGCLATPICIKLLGPFLSLLLVQSKGWPFQLVMWAAYDFAMLYGDSKFARHWLYYQNAIHVFNANNEAGHVLEADSWNNILVSAMVVGAAVCLKRFFVGLWYGQGVFRQYGKDLATIMHKAILIGKVSALAKNKVALSQAQHFDLDFEKLGQEVGDTTSNDDDDDTEEHVDSERLLIDIDRKNLYSAGDLSQSQKVLIHDLLGEWEEPVIDDRKVEVVPVSSIVQFQAAVDCVDKDFPFSPDFGLADKREKCIDSSQKLFLRLESSENDSDGILKFDTIATVAIKKKNGSLDEKQLKELIGIFRPTRDGEITMLDFVKSIDAVYKDLRIIRASIYNAQKMNAASQKLVNTAFYFILVWVVLAILELDPTALFASVIAFVVGFSFMVGGAASQYFEGLLMVLVRKPYDIGDRIAVSNVNTDASGTGSSGWIVKDLDLYKTTVIFGTTNEEATYSNGSLARMRIINHNRSPKASLNFIVRFGIDVEKEKVKAFSQAVEQFVKDRPREWLNFGAFRLANVCPDLGYVEYKVIMAHREAWQQIGALLTSKADVQLFGYELSKEMDMGYENPAMPIILTKRLGSDHGESSGENDEAESFNWM